MSGPSNITKLPTRTSPSADTEFKADVERRMAEFEAGERRPERADARHQLASHEAGRKGTNDEGLVHEVDLERVLVDLNSAYLFAIRVLVSNFLHEERPTVQELGLHFVEQSEHFAPVSASVLRMLGKMLVEDAKEGKQSRDDLDITPVAGEN